MPQVLNIIPVPVQLLTMFPDWANTEAKISAAATLFRTILRDLNYSPQEVGYLVNLHVQHTVGNAPAFHMQYQTERFQTFKRIASPRMGWKDFYLLSKVLMINNIQLTITANVHAVNRFASVHTISHYQD